MSIPKGIVLYHYPCPDGAFAALMAEMICPGQYDLIPHNTKVAITEQELRDLAVKSNGKLVLLDYCGPKGFILMCSRIFQQVVLVDHHKTANEYRIEEKWDELPNFVLQFSSTLAGCTLARSYFINNADPVWHCPGNVEELLDYVQDNDLWSHKLPQSKEFSAGLRSLDLDYNFQRSSRVLNIMQSLDPIALIRIGRQVLLQEEKIIAYALLKAYKVRLHDEIYYAAECNVWEVTSELGARLAELGTGYGCVVKTDKDNELKMNLSLRSTGPDKDTTVFSRFAGGGGHAVSSGCSVPRDVWNSFKIDSK